MSAVRGIVRGSLIAGLIVWAACAPLVWILRDGLGPGMVESGGWDSVGRFLALWGLPGLVFVGPLAILLLIDRWFGASDGDGEQNSIGDSPDDRIMRKDDAD